MGVRMAPEVVTEGSGWHEQVADRAECGVGYAGTGRDRRSAVAELGKRVAAAEAAFGLPGVTVVRRRLSVHDQRREHVLERGDVVEPQPDVLRRPAPDDPVAPPLVVHGQAPAHHGDPG